MFGVCDSEFVTGCRYYLELLRGCSIGTVEQRHYYHCFEISDYLMSAYRFYRGSSPGRHRTIQ